MSNKYYENKYLKYKQKYFELKYNMFGGNNPTIEQGQALLKKAIEIDNEHAKTLANKYLHILKLCSALETAKKRDGVNPKLLLEINNLTLAQIDAAAAADAAADTATAAAAAAAAASEAAEEADVSVLARTANALGEAVRLLREAVRFADNVIKEFDYDAIETPHHAPAPPAALAAAPPAAPPAALAAALAAARSASAPAALPAALIEEINSNQHFVMTINDPHTRNVIPGDVDDIYSLLYLAQIFKDKLYVIIVDINQRRKQKQFQEIIKYMKNTYNCMFFYDEEISTDSIDPDQERFLVDNFSLLPKLLNQEFLFCTISAPVKKESLSQMIQIASKNNGDMKFYLQGGIDDGYNFGSSTINSYKNWVINTGKSQVINVSSEQTNHFLTKDGIDEITFYNTHPMTSYWDIYQLMKIFSVVKSPIPTKITYGFWFRPGDLSIDDVENTPTNLEIISKNLRVLSKFGSKANTDGTFEEIWSQVSDKVKKFTQDELENELSRNEQLIDIHKQLFNTYEVYLKESVASLVEGVLVNNTSDDKSTLSEILIATILKKLLIKYKLVTDLAVYLFRHNTINIITKGNDIRTIGELNIDLDQDTRMILRNTPRLYDLNMSILIIKLIEDNNRLPDQKDIPTAIDKTPVLSTEYILEKFNSLLAKFKSNMESYPHAVFDKNLREIF